MKATAIALLAIALQMIGSGHASAQIATLTCPLGSTITHYTPGITNTPKPTTLESTSLLSACVGLPLGISNATITTSGSGNLGCDGGTPSVTTNVVWSDGTTSSAQANNIVVQRPLGQVIVIEESEIISGRFIGATLVRTLTLLQTDFDGCSSPEGVTSVGGPTTLTMTNLL